jgi:quercetin dioxygenase-like cupin family protein
MANASMVFVSLMLPLMCCSCATQREATHYWYAESTLTSRQIETALKENPLPPEQNFWVINLGETREVSDHLVQIRDREELHTHDAHDLTVFVYRGHGTMRVGTETFPLRAGDVLFIPRGVVHAFGNESHAPAVAIVAFTPAFDGKDTVPAKK